MMLLTPQMVAASVDADLVLTRGDKTYVCRFDRGKRDLALPADEQEIWQIKLIDSSVAGQVRTLYPDGSKLPKFSLAQIENYNYKYSI